MDLPNRYCVTVKFYLESESTDDAIDDIQELIQEGIINKKDKRNKIYEFDVTESEPAEV